MAARCVHKGCGKTFTDPEEECIYHSGPPEFHEGQKGWKCCKPRVLTFDEFLAIPPCTTGKHSTVGDTPAPDPKPEAVKSYAALSKPPASTSELPIPPPRLPQSALAQTRQATPAPEPDTDSDDPNAAIPDNVICKRRSCGTSSSAAQTESSTDCIYHSGHPIFHEGSKGWTCCKRRVLEFDEFLKIQGCKMRVKHCFVGKRKSKRKEDGATGEEYEKLATVKHDFYQTGSTLHVSIYLKKIDKDKSRVEFKESGTEVELDLKTQDGKQYATTVPLYGKINPEKSAFKILGTKLDLTLAKADGAGWPVLRSDEKLTGEIIQIGSAGRA